MAPHPHPHPAPNSSSLAPSRLGRPSRRWALGAAAAATAALAGGLAGASPAGAAGPGGPAPLRRAHAHNDYAHPRPLHDALDHGFTSVEADVWLVDGELLVAHDAWELDPARTLTALYLDPLWHRVRAHGGTVFPGHRLPLQLLVDLKTEGASTYRALAALLARYRPMLTASVHGRVRARAVTAVVSGDRAAREPIAAEPVRHAFYDARLADLGSGAPPSFAPLVSDSWEAHFTWRGAGPMPEDERARLRGAVRAAHAAGQRVRFWATPDLPGPSRTAVWHALLDAGVDHVNTDDLAGLAAFLRAHDRPHAGANSGSNAPV